MRSPGPPGLFLLFYCVAMVFTVFLEGLLKSSIGWVAGRLAEVVCDKSSNFGSGRLAEVV